MLFQNAHGLASSSIYSAASILLIPSVSSCLWNGISYGDVLVALGNNLNPFLLHVWYPFVVATATNLC